MKTIIINLENSNSIVVEDDDNSNIEEYIKNLTKVLESNNISIIHTTTSSIIIRPNKIISVVVNDSNDNSDNEKKLNLKQVTDKKESNEISEDIITD